jgi:hypothetical protein
MPTVAMCSGIYLPNGSFVANIGDGHIENARRICNTFPELDELSKASFEREDDFMLQCGCAIVAHRDGHLCFEVAKDNPFSIIIHFQQEYEKIGVEIWSYWKINTEYLPVINNLLSKEFNLAESSHNTRRDLMKSDKKKTGFLIRSETGFKWYENKCCFHEDNALEIIREQGWLQEWRDDLGSCQDFLVSRKGAVQLGAAGIAERIILSRSFYAELNLREIKKAYDIEDFEEIWAP